MKYDGDPQQLGFFLAQVMSHMHEYGREIPSESGWVRFVTIALEHATACWMVTLHNADAPELQNFNHFMAALRQRFEDPLADQKARDSIKMVRQG